MWKVTFHRPHDGTPSVYWVNAESPRHAEAAARRQARDPLPAGTRTSVDHADDLNPADEPWPRPTLINGVRVFEFDDSASAYDQTQCRDDIHDGDVLHIPSEDVAGFLMQAWPVATSINTGNLHRLANPDTLIIDGVDYTASARVAATLVPIGPIQQQPVRLNPARTSRYLRFEPGVWTITIAGSERHDGEGPYIWVVNARDPNTAAAKAQHHHRTSQDDTDTIVRSIEPGAPNADYLYGYNDLRGIASHTVVLTPGDIRRIASIRLAYKRRDNHYARVRVDPRPGEPFPPHERETLDEMTAAIVDLIGDLMEDLGHPLWDD